MEVQNVLVVGCGNSGMEIAYDLASHGANTSIVHVVTKEIIRLGMTLVQHKPVNVVDDLLCEDLGPLVLKAKIGRSTVIDVGAVGLIKNGTIKFVYHGRCLEIFPKIKGYIVEFDGRKENTFHAIVLATGYKSTANTWLKNGESMLNDDGLPSNSSMLLPLYGANGLYCAGLAKRGLAGIAMDAKNIANDILSNYHA
uniref:indole-3-pyruvate monooxygenase n=1 Tax=Setaria viridis TaxID=4556 RepID=A0A4U6TI50_SETVI|nr:hypothetical protein SEVIR_8G172800v2 [Setaria viridis]